MQPTGGKPPPALDCTGTFEVEFNTRVAAGGDPNLVAGAPGYAQAWGREPRHPGRDARRAELHLRVFFWGAVAYWGRVRGFNSRPSGFKTEID